MVTGGGGGLGKAVSEAFSVEGAKVVVGDFRTDAARKVAQEINELGGRAIAEKLDVRSYQEIEEVVRKTVSTFGRLDILVNCAAICTIHRFDEITEQLWDDTMDINAKGTFLCCKAAALQMINQGRGGKIINISSQSGKLGFARYTHYCASKFAVLGITQSLALELAKYNINVHAVCPSDINTEMLHSEARMFAKERGISFEEMMKDYVDTTPLGRLIQPSDVANLVLFLASEEAKNMTGQGVNITGGKVLL